MKSEILFCSVIIALIIPAIAYAQTDVIDEVEIEIQHYAYSFLIFVAAGILYTSAGYIKQFRRSFAGEAVTFDVRKASKSLILGVGMGIAALIFTVYSGDNTLILTDTTQAATLWAIATTAILFIDKTILGRPSSVPATDDARIKQEIKDEEDEDEEPEELPPGK